MVQLCSIQSIDESIYLSELTSDTISLNWLAKASSDFDICIDDLVKNNIDYAWIENPVLPNKYLASKG